VVEHAEDFDLHNQQTGRDFIYWMVLTTIGFFVLQILIKPFELADQILYQTVQYLILFILAGAALGFMQWLQLRKRINQSAMWILVNGLSFSFSFVGIYLVSKFTNEFSITNSIIPMNLVLLVDVIMITFPLGFAQYVFLTQKNVLLRPGWMLHGIASAIFIVIAYELITIVFSQVFSTEGYRLLQIRAILSIAIISFIYGVPTAYAFSAIRFPRIIIAKREKEAEIRKLEHKPFIKRLPKWIGIFTCCVLIWIVVLFPVALIVYSQTTWILWIAIAIAGAIRGSIQWLGFRKSIPNSKLWIAITAGSEAIGAGLVLILGESGLLNGLFRYDFPIFISGLILALILGLPVGVGQWLFLKKRGLELNPIWMGYEAINLYLVIFFIYLFQNFSPNTNGFMGVLIIIFGFILFSAACILPSALAFAWLPFHSGKIEN
jgi:uncharacterized membrane protein